MTANVPPVRTNAAHSLQAAKSKENQRTEPAEFNSMEDEIQNLAFTVVAGLHPI